MTSGESVANVELSASSHPDLAGYSRGDALVFPGMLTLEAMAQAAAPLADAAGVPAGVPVIENAKFDQPVVIPPGGSAAISIAARAAQDRVEVEINGSGHAHATMRYTTGGPLGTSMQHPPGHQAHVPLDPAADLYGVILPAGQGPRRILGYRKLTAGSCVAEVSTQSGPRRPGSFPATDPVLGDPGIRHAFLDAIAGCAPHVRLHPVAIDRLYPAAGYGCELVLVSATERHRHDATCIYDLDVHTPDGRLLERWEGLRLIAEPEPAHPDPSPWVPSLLGPHLERGLEALIGGKPRCVVEPSAGDRAQVTEAVRRALGRPALVWHRADGRPEVAEEGIFVCAAHGAGVLLAMASTGPADAGATPARERSAQDWRALFGRGQFDLAKRIGRQTNEPLSVAATRVHAAAQHLPPDAEMTPTRVRPDGWVQLACGDALITTFAARLRDVPGPVVFTIATQAISQQGPQIKETA